MYWLPPSAVKQSGKTMIAGAIFFCSTSRAARSGTFSPKLFQLVWLGPPPTKPTRSNSTGKRASASLGSSYCGGSQTCSGRTNGSPSGLPRSTLDVCVSTATRPGARGARLIGTMRAPRWSCSARHGDRVVARVAVDQLAERIDAGPRRARPDRQLKRVLAGNDAPLLDGD